MTETQRAPLEMSRRAFVTRGLAAAGGLVIGLRFSPSLSPAAAAEAVGTGGVVTLYVRIGADETVTITCPIPDMGQGVESGLAQIVAEELKVDWAKVRTDFAPADVRYTPSGTSGSQITGGSRATRNYFQPLRVAGATAREMLIAAGAARLGVPSSSCEAVQGVVRVKGDATRSVTYGSVAADAAKQPVPSNPPLTDPAKFELIRKAVRRTDLAAKVRGAAVYGIDVRLPGMVYASVQQALKVRQTAKSWGAPPAGMRAIAVQNGAAIVVTGAKTTWHAIKAARELSVTWVDGPDTAAADSAAMAQVSAGLLTEGEARPAETSGDVGAAFAGAARRIVAEYRVPHVAHATMEPMNATALVTRDGRCEVWAPSQSQTATAAAAASAAGVPVSSVTVHQTYMGGGLGRRIETDYVVQAVAAARATPDTPVKLVWSREEDFTHDYYRPAATCRLEAGLASDGALVALKARVVVTSIRGQRDASVLTKPDPRTGQPYVDKICVEGLAAERLYPVANTRIEWVHDPAPVRVGYWRSVGHSHNCFFIESFVDEIAAAVNQDPLAYRRKLLIADARKVAVLDRLAKNANWAAPTPAGRARGMAMTESFGSLCALAVEISGSPSAPKVERVTGVIDCGIAVNPDAVRAQVQGSVIHGLSAAFTGEMPFSQGTPMRRNFNTYKLTRLAETPRIDVDVIDSNAPVGGVGETGVPALAPALANAIVRLGGARPRKLPLQ